jgi:hypothetical protein
VLPPRMDIQTSRSLRSNHPRAVGATKLRLWRARRDLPLRGKLSPILLAKSPAKRKQHHPEKRLQHCFLGLFCELPPPSRPLRRASVCTIKHW